MLEDSGFGVLWKDGPVTGTPRRSAPYQEWVLMYRRGLSRRQIADLTDAAAATVGYHLGLARTQNPACKASTRLLPGARRGRRVSGECGLA